MGRRSVPAYEEWRRYCFVHGHADFISGAGIHCEDRACQFTQIPPHTVLGYLTRCFRESASLTDEFTAASIGDGVRFLFGWGSEYFSTIRESGIAPSHVAECYRAVATLYRECLDRVCCRGATDPDGDYINRHSVDGGVSNRLDGAVYMIWDMDQIDPVLWFPDDYPELFEASVNVLRDVLKHCRTSTCKISALHAIGHMSETRRELAERLVDDFLKRPGQPEFVVEYAKAARRGGVQ